MHLAANSWAESDVDGLVYMPAGVHPCIDSLLALSTLYERICSASDCSSAAVCFKNASSPGLLPCMPGQGMADRSAALLVS